MNQQTEVKEEKPILFAPSSWGQTPGNDDQSQDQKDSKGPKIDQAAQYFKFLAKKKQATKDQSTQKINIYDK